MPSGRTHDRITLWGLPLVSGLTFRLTRSLPLTLITSLGYLVGGLMLGPDLDIHSIQYKRWGVFRWIWLPYQGSLKHRSRLSHGPIIGTLIRVTYLSVWLAIFGLLLVELVNGPGNGQLTWADLRDGMTRSAAQYRWEWVALLVGLELGALLHSVSDWLVSRHKRRRKKRKR